MKAKEFVPALFWAVVLVGGEWFSLLAAPSFILPIALVPMLLGVFMAVGTGALTTLLGGVLHIVLLLILSAVRHYLGDVQGVLPAFSSLLPFAMGLTVVDSVTSRAIDRVTAPVGKAGWAILGLALSVVFLFPAPVFSFLSLAGKKFLHF